mmetsp:Transcript_102743/g.299695  ORF Transcript_102743/g.299695 Transcript_102743/m.299695 type:complete len:207 (+) Transcript_102743:646-1266(+)
MIQDRIQRLKLAAMPRLLPVRRPLAARRGLRQALLFEALPLQEPPAVPAVHGPVEEVQHRVAKGARADAQEVQDPLDVRVSTGPWYKVTLRPATPIHRLHQPIPLLRRAVGALVKRRHLARRCQARRACLEELRALLVFQGQLRPVSGTGSSGCPIGVCNLPCGFLCRLAFPPQPPKVAHHVGLRLFGRLGWLQPWDLCGLRPALQ